MSVSFLCYLKLPLHHILEDFYTFIGYFSYLLFGRLHSALTAHKKQINDSDNLNFTRCSSRLFCNQF